MKLIASAAWGNVVHDRNSEIFNWHINKRCFVFGTARLCLSLGFPVPIDWYCKSKSHNEPCTDLEKGMPCTKEKEFSLLRYDLCSRRWLR